MVLGVQVAPNAPGMAIEEGCDLVVGNGGGEGGCGDDAAKVVEHGWSSLAGVEKDGVGGMVLAIQALSQPHFDGGLAGDAHAGGPTVQLLHHPEGEVDVDTVELQALTAGLAHVEGVEDGIAVIKALIELKGFHRGESLQGESGEQR